MAATEEKDTGHDAASAAAYRAAREIPLDGLRDWRQTIAAQAQLQPGQTVLDVGAGTGAFATAFHQWYGVRVLAIEPAEAMRALIPAVPEQVEVLDGCAEQLPVPDAVADAAWLASVIHHLTDLEAAARELRRALKPGAPVLIRNTFPGRCEGDLRVRFFPEVARTIDGYPSVEQVTASFAKAGFQLSELHSVPQHSAADLRQFAAKLDRESDSKLRALSDEDYARGVARLRAAVSERPTQSALSWMNLLVLR